MNFIYSLVFWVMCFLVTTLFKHLNADWIEAMFVLQIIFIIVFFVFTVVAFFYTASERHTARMVKNTIKKYEKDISQQEEKYEKLKEYYEHHLAENYPNMEREVFGKIAESQPKELIALFQAYPELQTSTVLTNMMDKITQLMGKIYDLKENINYCEERLDNIRTNPWLIIKSGI